MSAPIVHIVHHRPLAGLASLAVHAALPAIGWYAGGGGSVCETTCKTAVGSCAEDPNGDYWHVTSTSCSGGGIFGVTAGGLLASLFDATVLSWETRPTAETSPKAASSSSRGLSVDSAGLVPLHAGAALSLGGHF